MPLVDSFSVDHTTMKAPNVRKAKVVMGPMGDTVEVYDLRFIKPNALEIMTNEAVHTLEHLLATYMREKLDNIIDVSPMGCRTGFYMSVFNENDESVIKNALIYSLEKVLNTQEIPGASEKECGNYLCHSLEHAKAVAEKVLSGF
jgi:S-ribosylhomocysteine lyase